MSPEIKKSVPDHYTEIIKTVSDDFPFGIVIWQTDHSLLFINNHAAQLTGFANADLLEATALWGERVHIDDRATFSSSWRELRKGTRQSTCDYRFFPKHSKSTIRLTEVSVLTPDLQRVVSVYFRIADLSEQPKHKETDLRILLHDIQNYLHVVKFEIELSGLGLQRRIDVLRLAKTLSSEVQLPRDLREYLGANAMSMTIEDLESVLKNVVRRIQCQLHRQKTNLRLVRLGPLRRVEVSTTSAESMGINVSDSLRSSVQVGENEVEIALNLAKEILRRYHGQVTFRQENARVGK